MNAEPPRQWTHTQVQALLLTWGRCTGHEVWVAKGDRSRFVDGACLRTRSLERIPTCLPARVYSVLEQVDTIWFPLGGAMPVALFEVEHSTSILGGLLRMNDVLMSLAAPVEGWRFHIVAPARRLSRFSGEIARPTFEASGLAGLCRFLSYEEVLDGCTNKKALR